MFPPAPGGPREGAAPARSGRTEDLILALNCLRAVLIALVAMLGFAPGAFSAQTVVSLAFDDGIATQNFARTQLAAHSMHGTFYINSGNIEAPDNPYYM